MGEVDRPMDLYATKAATLARLDPLIDRLAAANVSPDRLTLAAIPVAIVAGASLLASTLSPAWLIAVPVLAALRLVLNLLDGAVARRTGRMHPRGELYNEVGDRSATSPSWRRSPSCQTHRRPSSCSGSWARCWRA